MMPYLFEKLAQTHHEDLLREAEQQRLVAQLSESERSRHTLAARLESFLRIRSREKHSVKSPQDVGCASSDWL
jgi:hypothetical protein